MSALSDAIAALQSKVAALDGIQAAPASVPENIDVYPFAVCYPKAGRLALQSAGWATYTHVLICEIHVSRVILKEAVNQAIPYLESLAAAIIADPQLNEKVYTILRFDYTFGYLKWAGVETLGIRFEIEVKLNQTGG